MSEQLLESLGFPNWTQANGRRSVADLYRSKQRCGIYVLGFTDGEMYVGQAVDVVRRFTQHCKTHDVICQLTFQQIPRQNLNQVERHCIHVLEAAGILLRNLTYMSIVQGERNLDLVVTPEEQKQWYNGSTNVSA